MTFTLARCRETLLGITFRLLNDMCLANALHECLCWIDKRIHPYLRRVSRRWNCRLYNIWPDLTSVGISWLILVSHHLLLSMVWRPWSCNLRVTVCSKRSGQVKNSGFVDEAVIIEFRVTTWLIYHAVEMISESKRHTPLPPLILNGIFIFFETVAYSFNINGYLHQHNESVVVHAAVIKYRYWANINCRYWCTDEAE